MTAYCPLCRDGWRRLERNSSSRDAVVPYILYRKPTKLWERHTALKETERPLHLFLSFKNRLRTISSEEQKGKICGGHLKLSLPFCSLLQTFFFYERKKIEMFSRLYIPLAVNHCPMQSHRIPLMNGGKIPLDSLTDPPSVIGRPAVSVSAGGRFRL